MGRHKEWRVVFGGCGLESMGRHREWRVLFGGYGMWGGMYGKT